MKLLKGNVFSRMCSPVQSDVSRVTITNDVLIFTEQDPLALSPIPLPHDTGHWDP